MKNLKAYPANESWKSLYKIGGIAALLAVFLGIIEIAITFLPGGNVLPETVIDWFLLFQENWFLSLRHLGLLNILVIALGLLTSYALYGVHRDANETYAALALIIFILGAATFYGTNRAFAMLDLSNQYAATTTDEERALLVSAGQAMLAVGRSHTPGTFITFLFTEISSLVMSWVMLRSKIFSTVNAYAGILGFGLLIIYELISAFIPTFKDHAHLLAMLGGLFSMVWYLMIARKLFRLE